MGLELAERRLLGELRATAPTTVSLELRIPGGRSARRYARQLGGRWIPALPHALPRAGLFGADLVHLLGLDLQPPQRKPFVAMVHDLAPLLYDDEGTLPPWADEIVERASLLLTPSAFTATEVTQHFSVPAERIRVIGGGPALEAYDAEPLSRSELQQLGIDPPFVLRVGGYTKRKNVPLLLEAWARVPVGTLVLAGPPQPSRTRILDQAPARDRIVTLDYVPASLLARLLRTAAVLASSSSYEGFGLPPLEALAAGTPVVAVVTPVVQEICGTAALIVEARPDRFAEALHHVLTDTELADRLRASGFARAKEFGWNIAAAAVFAAYDSVATQS